MNQPEYLNDLSRVVSALKLQMRPPNADKLDDNDKIDLAALITTLVRILAKA